jgi:hypothetical protein
MKRLPGTKLTKLLADNPLDPDRPFPDDLLMPNFTRMPYETQRMLIESQNTGRKYKPLDPRKYPGLKQSGVQVDPKLQKVCPVCFMVIKKWQLQRFFGGTCPKCGCRLQI